MIKLIASDLDGTLIGHDFRFRPRTLRALEAARAAGALGAKLTGGGLGGCVIALVAGEPTTRRVRAALERAGASQTWSYRMRVSEVDE